MKVDEETLYHRLRKICGSKNLSNDPILLKDYSSDMSFYEGVIPKIIVWPKKVKQIIEILNLANHMDFSIIPVSSSLKFRHHGDTIPRNEDSIILNLSKMKKIHSIDRKNRVVMIEPGVDFANLIPKLKKEGLRLLLPLYSTGTKSVITSALEREPITIPRYHWDSSDPL
jgi:FAD/FMN-containing dehydrogenase